MVKMLLVELYIKLYICTQNKCIFQKTSYPSTDAVEAHHSELLPKNNPAVKFKNANWHGVQLLVKPRNTRSSQYFTLSKLNTNNNF